jgi:TPP-dependent indolepyruvate ferredoxin oxidoreductase alpha subunit
VKPRPRWTSIPTACDRAARPISPCRKTASTSAGPTTAGAGNRLLHHKLYAALAYCRANGSTASSSTRPRPRLGIITTGKSYLDVRQAFDDLGIDDALAAEIGIRLYKVGMVWPLESEACATSPKGWKKSWWSRKSASSSNTS